MPSDISKPSTSLSGSSLYYYTLRFLDHTNLTVTALSACAVLYTRSAGVAYFTAGAVACSLTVKMLKRVLRQPRPLHHTHRKKTYGMPSTHSATITYYATYIPLACLYLPLHSSFSFSPTPAPSYPLIRLLPPLVVIPWATLIALSRVWLGHHTWPQVCVGCAYGFGFAWVWMMGWVWGVQGGGREWGGVVEGWVEGLIEGMRS